MRRFSFLFKNTLIAALALTCCFFVQAKEPLVGPWQYYFIRCDARHGPYPSDPTEIAASYYYGSCGDATVTSARWGTVANPTRGTCGSSKYYPKFLEEVENENTKDVKVNYCKHVNGGYNDGLTVYRVRSVELKQKNESGPPDCASGSLGVGDPIKITSGNSVQTYHDIPSSEGHLAFTRTYNSLRANKDMGLGKGWTFAYNHRLVVFAHNGINKASLHRSDGQEVQLTEATTGSGLYSSDQGSGYILQLLSADLFELETPDGSREQYGTDGSLQRVVKVNGEVLSFDYHIGGNNAYGYKKLKSVRDQNGAQLLFDWYFAETSPRLKSVADATLTVNFNYTGTALTSVIYTGEAYSASVTYNYVSATTGYDLLVGVVDEQGRSYATWGFADNYGVASYSANGSVADLKKATKIAFSVLNSTQRRAVVTNAFGKETTYTYQLINDAYRVTHIDGAASSNCAASAANISYDANGLRDKVTDNEGNVTDYDYDALGLPLSITEGLRWQDPLSRSSTITTSSTRSTQITWRPTRQLNSVTTSTLATYYEYYPNNSIQRITQIDLTAYNNTLGSTNGQTRTWDYSYTYYSGEGIPEDVMVDTMVIDGPLAGSADRTAYHWDTQGNLLSITNALGHTHVFSDHNDRGQAQTIADANGVITRIKYHPRGWLDEILVAGPEGNSVTDYLWYPNGTLEQVTFPDGSYLHYEYNDARYLVEIKNNLGEVVRFSLNAMGDWTLEETKDTSGTIKRQQQRAFDELGRLMDLFGATNQRTHYRYDRNNNLQSIEQYGEGTALTQTFSYDALNRLQEVLQPIQQSVSGSVVSANAITQYAYDANGKITGVIDPENKATTYWNNGFGERLRAVSPDTQTTDYWYDSQGNLSDKIDARGVQVRYSHDLLGRLIQISYLGDNRENIQYFYDEVSTDNPYALGRLTRLTDSTGSTRFIYDHRGNVLAEIRTIAGQVYTTQYTYNLANNLSSITYPSGRIVHYKREDALGRVSQVTMQDNAADTEKTLATSLAYLPFGPVNQLQYGNALQLKMLYDLDYRIDSIATGNAFHIDLSYDVFGNIQSLSSTTDSHLNQNFEYDELARLTKSQLPTDTLSFEYDLVGNRTLLSTNRNQTAYVYAADSHRLESDATWSYEYDAAGNLTRRYDAKGNQLLLSYNQRNRLMTVLRETTTTKVTTTEQTEYDYNARGQRTIKRSASGDTHYLYNIDGQLIAEANGEGSVQVEYIYLNGQVIAVTSFNTSTAMAAPITRDNTATTTTGAWSLTRSNKALNRDYLLARAGSTSSATWPLALKAGHYDVYARWIANKLNSKQVPYTIRHKNLIDIVSVDQTTQNATWVLLGTFEFDGSGTEHIRVDSNQGRVTVDAIELRPHPVIQTDYQLHFIHTDHLGTPRSMSDATGRRVWTADYDPFGQATVNEDPDGDGKTSTLHLRFPGQYFDLETGLHYNYFRDYDPALGRYVQSDPIGLRGGVNTYTYVEGNPVSYVDPLGLYGTTSCAYYSQACEKSGGYACGAQYVCPVFPTGQENSWLQCVRQCLQEEHHRREESESSCPITDNPYTDHTTCFAACGVNSGNPGLPGAPPRP